MTDIKQIVRLKFVRNHCNFITTLHYMICFDLELCNVYPAYFLILKEVNPDTCLSSKVLPIIGGSQQGGGVENKIHSQTRFTFCHELHLRLRAGMTHDLAQFLLF